MNVVSQPTDPRSRPALHRQAVPTSAREAQRSRQRDLVVASLLRCPPHRAAPRQLRLDDASR
jgi:hypothetical protein